MKGMNDMVRQAQMMHKKMIKLQEELKEKVVEAGSGGGMVKASVSGGMELKALKIDPSVLEGGDMEMLQDLIAAAVNEALKKAKEMSEHEMSQVTGNIKIPGLF